VVEESLGSKMEEAKDLGVAILEKDALLKLLGESHG
jgi:NAD-dependent DNA ligase